MAKKKKNKHVCPRCGDFCDCPYPGEDECIHQCEGTIPDYDDYDDSEYDEDFDVR